MLTTAAKNQMLDGLTVDRVMLHNGNPGGAGTDNQVSGLVAATFAAASNGERALASQVDFTGLTSNVSVTYFSIWLNSGTVFKGYAAISSGDVQANAAGEYSLTTATKITLSDA